MPAELLLIGPGELELATYDELELGRRSVRARALVSGISQGTELSLVRGSSPFRTKRFDPDLRLFVADEERGYPLRLGYEWVGEVTAVGEDVHEVRVGDRVHAALPHRETQTIDLEGAALWSLLTPSLAPDHAAFLQSTTIALQAVHDAEIALGGRVAVFGLGVFGLLTVQLARRSGAVHVVAVDPVPERRALAARLGADRVLDPVDAAVQIKTAGAAVDVAIEFSGRYDALHEALRSVRLAGRVVAAGFYAGGGDALRLGEEFHHNRLTLVSSMQGWGAPSRRTGWDRPRLRATALSLLAEEGVSVDRLVTHRHPFGMAPEAYRLIGERPAEVLRMLLAYDTA
jgi:2-desacetyl-2-hydroxyethyl bacteriochlorophyllide A dehydrogenase